MLPFESFSYPFFDLNFEGDHGLTVKSFLNKEQATQKGLKSLYIHIPFCDTICNFCPFVKSVGTEQRIADYLSALFIELRDVGATQRISSWKLDAIYIGGGTPSVLSVPQLEALFEVIYENFSLSSECEISFEFEAKSVSLEKFKALRDLGVTRSSFGVQSFDPVIREQSNLTATLEEIYNAIEWSTAVFKNTNLDMMVGFPGQDTDSAILDMKTAATSGIGSVSVYPVDYVMTLPAWQSRIRSGELPAPSKLSERDEMFHAARDELKKHMYEQNMYCFGSEDSPATKYMFSILYGGYYDEAIGVGTGSYSFIQGLSYYNDSNERNYVKRLRAGESPVAQSSPGHAYEKGLVFFPKRLTYDMSEADELGLRGIYDHKIDAIVSKGLATLSENTLRLTPAGERQYSEIMAHFFSDQQSRLYERITDRLKNQVGIFDDSDWSDGSSRVKDMGAHTAMGGAGSNRVAKFDRKSLPLTAK